MLDLNPLQQKNLIALGVEFSNLRDRILTQTRISSVIENKQLKPIVVSHINAICYHNLYYSSGHCMTPNSIVG